MEMHKPAWP